jgi:hypothetical protein
MLELVSQALRPSRLRSKDQAVADVTAAAAHGALLVETTPDCRCAASRSSKPPTRTPRWKAA